MADFGLATYVSVGQAMEGPGGRGTSAYTAVIDYRAKKGAVTAALDVYAAGITVGELWPGVLQGSV